MAIPDAVYATTIAGDRMRDSQNPRPDATAVNGSGSNPAK